MRRGQKSISQTPAPPKERIKGSKVNPKGSAASKSSAASIELSDSVLATLQNKKEEYNEKHPNGRVSLATLKAVFRRGAGAYSTSHRPTITGGAPNSRSAWAFARVNKFLLKKGGTKVKAAYVQDDDLMAKGGIIKVVYDNDNIDYDSLNDLFEYGYRSDMGIGEPYIYLIEEGKIIGCIFLNDNIFFDGRRGYEFDIVIKEDKRGKGYAKLLLDEMINNFVNKYKKSPNILANVINDELSKYLVNKYGFVCQGSLGYKYENLCYLTREKAIEYLKSKQKFEDGGLIAPNGKKSNLTPEQYKLVRTPEFKSWFGDWENDPENASKVVDENGEPLVVYHGTKDGRFTIFDKDKFGLRTQNINSIAFFFTPSLWYAEAYSESKNNDRIKQYKEIFGETPTAIEPRPFAEEKVCFLNIRNPKYVNSQTKEDILLAKEELYDGIILKTKDKISFFEIGAFEPNQIKLADGSNTTFDANNPDIRYEEGGLIKSLSMGMDNLKKNGIVLKDENTIVIAYNTGNQKIEPSLYNKALIYKSIKPIKSASNIIEKLDLQRYDSFDEGKINDYKKGHLIILNQNEVIYDSGNSDIKYKNGGYVRKSEVERIKKGLMDGYTYSNMNAQFVRRKDGVMLKYNNIDGTYKFYNDIDSFARTIVRFLNRGYKDGGLMAKGGEVPNNLIDLPYYKKGYEGAEYWSFSEDEEKKEKSDKWFDLMIKHQKNNIKLTKLELNEFKNLSLELSIEENYEDGGLIAPNGKKSNLNPEQYKLVRTPEFKAWFGDWENDPENKLLDVNGEPLIFYRGSIEKLGDLGYEFILGLNLLKKPNKNNFGFFFTDKKEMAEKYASSWDDKIIGEVNSFFIRTNRILDLKNFGLKISQDEFIDGLIQKGISFDNYPDMPNHILNYFEKNEYKGWGSYVFDYFDVFPELRNLFLDNGYNCVIFKENSRSSFFWYDVFVVFESNQIKLADGSNTTFDANNPDIRFEEGGETGEEITCHNCGWEWNTNDSDSDDKYVCHHCGFDNSEYYKMGGMLKTPHTLLEIAKKHKMKVNSLIKPLSDGVKFEMEHTNSKETAKTIALHHLWESPKYYDKLKVMEKSFKEEGNYKRGGQINPDDKDIKRAAVDKSGATGGLLVGNRHSEGGIKAINKSSGTPLEMEGGEVVITRDAVSDNDKREFEGEMLTNREILSRINQSGGGISFAEGGDIPEKCSCSGKTYKYGGKVMKDYDIASYINGDGKDKRRVLENYYSSIEEKVGFAEGGVINGLEDLGDCARSFLVDIKNSGAQFLDYSSDKKNDIKELEDNDLIYFTNSPSFGCLTAFLTQKGKKLMSSIPAHLFKKGGVTDCGCGCGSFKDGGDLDSEKKYFKGVDYDYENQFLVNKAIEELLDMKDSSEMTIEEKNFLNYYSGYGGLEKFGATGKGLLYEYFTPSLIAKKMWALAYKHGFEGGLVIEPSCGIGEFIKYAPEQDSVHGYEINETSAKIASILYPKARIKTDHFEKLFIKNNYTIKGNIKGMNVYSLVIGNPPYGSMAGLYAGMGEKEYAKANNYIDYFILRGLDLLQSGGLLIYVIGTEVAAGGIPFLQQGITENKKLIAERAELVDAYRLPNGVFERTDVLTDIVVFKKK